MSFLLQRPHLLLVEEAVSVQGVVMMVREQVGHLGTMVVRITTMSPGTLLEAVVGRSSALKTRGLR
jgi:hypothetical protein